MSGRSWAACVAVAASLSLASPACAAAKGFDEAAFDTALAKAKANDPSADFGWLRQQNLLRFDYAIPDWDQAEGAFGSIDKSPQSALTLAQRQIESNYFDLFAHVVAEQALGQLGQKDKSQAEHDTVIAILASIMGANDGRSAEHAFKAVSIAEEYQTVALLGFDVKNQKTSTSGGHTYDVIDVADSESGETTAIWFEIDSFFGKELGL